MGAQLLSLATYEEEHFVANMLNKIFGYGAWDGGATICVGGDNSWLSMRWEVGRVKVTSVGPETLE